MAQLIETARIAKETTLRFTPDGTPVINLVLPCDYGKKSDGNTEWLECAIWGKRAEALAPYLLKGQWVSVTVGDVHVETYQSQNGQGHKLVGRVEQIKLVGPAPEQQQQPAQQSRQPVQQDDGWGDFDDDLPI